MTEGWMDGSVELPMLLFGKAFLRVLKTLGSKLCTGRPPTVLPPATGWQWIAGLLVAFALRPHVA
jgi:hypothetical protein